jgi:hypothetical protein
VAKCVYEDSLVWIEVVEMHSWSSDWNCVIVFSLELFGWGSRVGVNDVCHNFGM